MNKMALWRRIQTLPKGGLELSGSTEPQGKGFRTHATVQNPWSARTFFLCSLKNLEGCSRGRSATRVMQDNHFELMSQEREEVAAAYASKTLDGTKPAMAVHG